MTPRKIPSSSQLNGFPQSLSGVTLSTIQPVRSAAAYAADADLKNAVKDDAARVNAAMSANPYGLGNDALFENWKVVARLSQTLIGIAPKLKNVHHGASELITADPPRVHEIAALATPSDSVATGPGMPCNSLTQQKTRHIGKRRV